MEKLYQLPVSGDAILLSQIVDMKVLGKGGYPESRDHLQIRTRDGYHVIYVDSVEEGQKILNRVLEDANKFREQIVEDKIEELERRNK